MGGQHVPDEEVTDIGPQGEDIARHLRPTSPQRPSVSVRSPPIRDGAMGGSACCQLTSASPVSALHFVLKLYTRIGREGQLSKGVHAHLSIRATCSDSTSESSPNPVLESSKTDPRTCTKISCLVSMENLTLKSKHDQAGVMVVEKIHQDGRWRCPPCKERHEKAK